MKKLEKLKQDMHAARANLDKFMDDHSRPMSEEEMQHEDSPFRSYEMEALAEVQDVLEQKPPSVVELKTREEAKELQRLDKEVQDTHSAFVEEFQKKDWSHE